MVTDQVIGHLNGLSTQWKGRLPVISTSRRDQVWTRNLREKKPYFFLVPQAPEKEMLRAGGKKEYMDIAVMKSKNSVFGEYQTATHRGERENVAYRRGGVVELTQHTTNRNL